MLTFKLYHCVSKNSLANNQLLHPTVSLDNTSLHTILPVAHMQ